MRNFKCCKCSDHFLVRWRRRPRSTLLQTSRDSLLTLETHSCQNVESSYRGIRERRDKRRRRWLFPEIGDIVIRCVLVENLDRVVAGLYRVKANLERAHTKSKNRGLSSFGEESAKESPGDLMSHKRMQRSAPPVTMKGTLGMLRRARTQLASVSKSVLDSLSRSSVEYPNWN